MVILGNYLWGETRNISGTVTYFPIYNPFSNMIIVASCNPITATTFIYSLNGNDFYYLKYVLIFIRDVTNIIHSFY